MIQIEAKNEWVLANDISGRDLDLGVFLQALLESIGCTLSAAQSKKVWEIMADRNRKKAIIDEWREKGELHTEKDFPEDFANAVKEAYGVPLSSYISSEVQDRSGAFVELFGETYFNESGYGVILTAIQISKTDHEWKYVQKYMNS